MESDSLIRVKPDAVKIIPIGEIKLNSENRNVHPPDQIDRLAKMIQANGFRNPIIISNQSEVSIAGEGRVLAALKLGMTHVPVIFQDFDSPEQEYQFGVGDNAIAAWSTLDYSKIHHDIGDLGPFDIELLGIRDFTVIPNGEIEKDQTKNSQGQENRVKLSDRFLVPPFTILDARQGYWQERKRQWLSLGIKSELGRGGGRAVKVFNTH